MACYDWKLKKTRNENIILLLCSVYKWCIEDSTSTHFAKKWKREMEEETVLLLEPKLHGRVLHLFHINHDVFDITVTRMLGV